MNSILNKKEASEMICYLDSCRRVFIAKKRGFSIAALANSLDLSPTAISRVLYGTLHTPWIKVAVPKLLKIDYREFWGEEPPDFAAPARERLAAVGLCLEGED